MERDDDDVHRNSEMMEEALPRSSFIGSLTAMGLEVSTSGGSFLGYNRSYTLFQIVFHAGSSMISDMSLGSRV